MPQSEAIDVTKILGIASKRLTMFYAHELQELGIKIGHMMYLACICDYPGFSQDQIAANLYTDKSTVAKVVKELLQEGYITRELNPDFRREYTITPTAKGVQAGKRIEELKVRGEAFLTAKMTDIESDLFKRLLLKLPR